ncbi:MAG: disulfide bond formation protein B [Pseudomonadota bacterium]
MIEHTLCHIWILGTCTILIGAFWFQFAENELPCPLCMLQRMCMVLAAIGPAFILTQGRSAHHYGLSVLGSGLGMAILAAVGGMSISARQVLLHIAPNDAGYGSPILGLHLYTWALIVFVGIIVVSAITMLLEPELRPSEPKKLPWYSKATLTLFGLVIAANAIAALAESGPHLFLPADPERYEGLELIDRD